jgi:FkbM family methyltransferase
MTIKDMVRNITPTCIWEYLRSKHIRRKVKQFPRRVVDHSYCDQRLNVLIADGLGEDWYDHDWDKLEELDLLLQGKLRPGAKIFDLGAHQGVVAMIMAKIVGESGQVIAVEGMRHNCDVANENLRLNDIRSVTVHHAVISDQDGQLCFFDGLNGSVSTEGVGQMVEAITIDSLAKKYDQPDVVFIDIEGFEQKALQGAQQTLISQADWFVEVHVDCGLERYGGSVPGILGFFPAERYECYIWNLDAEQKPQPLVANSLVLTKRFAVVALNKQSTNRA